MLSVHHQQPAASSQELNLNSNNSSTAYQLAAAAVATGRGEFRVDQERLTVQLDQTKRGGAVSCKIDYSKSSVTYSPIKDEQEGYYLLRHDATDFLF